MKAFIITLMRDPVRRLNASHLERFLRDAGYGPEIFEAVDATGREFRDACVAQDSRLTAGEIATAQSHFLLHQRVAETGETCLIVEDDAWFPRPVPVEWAAGVQHMMTCGAYDSTVEGAPQLDYQEELEHGINTLGAPWGTQTYFITPEGARILAQGAKPIRHPMDVLMDSLSRQGDLQACVAKDCFVGQNDLIKSSVGPR